MVYRRFTRPTDLVEYLEDMRDHAKQTVDQTTAVLDLLHQCGGALEGPIVGLTEGRAEVRDLTDSDPGDPVPVLTAGEVFYARLLNWLFEKGALRVWLDDVRRAPPGWVHVSWPNEVIDLLRSGEVAQLSLDHDLGDDARGTGYDVLRWIEEQVHTSDFVPPLTINAHSANTAARKRMEAAIDAIYKAASMKALKDETP